MQKSWKDIYSAKRDAAALFQTIPSVIAEKFVTLLREQGTGKILDLGCGFGNYLPYFSRSGFSVIGSDISIVALRVAQSRMQRQRHLDTNLILHDMRELPFCNNSFDGIISVNVIYHGTMKEVKRVVSEIHRVLREGAFGLITLLADTDFKFDRTKTTGEKTLRAESEAERGIVHSFFNYEDTRALLVNFKLLQIEKEDKKFGDKLSSHWFVLFRNPFSSS